MSNRRSVLAELIATHDLEIGAEIGVGTGPTTEALLKRFPELHWIAVDHFPAGYPDGNGNPLSESRQEQVRRKFLKHVHIYSPRLEHIDKPSVEAAKSVDDGSLDIVFIDDDHSYEGCKASIEAWRPKLRPGGWLTGHDFDAECYPGVVQAVKELVPDYGLADDFVWLSKVQP